jgi:hypothetical protein
VLVAVVVVLATQQQVELLVLAERAEAAMAQ